MIKEEKKTEEGLDMDRPTKTLPKEIIAEEIFRLADQLTNGTRPQSIADKFDLDMIKKLVKAAKQKKESEKKISL